METLKFYEFRQNNPGGQFEYSDKISNVVWIEAPSINSAFDKAKQIGIYFDGVERGIDCNCCGDRWDEYPTIIDLEGVSLDYYLTYYKETRRETIKSFKADNHPYLIAHRADGTIHYYH